MSDKIREAFNRIHAKIIDGNIASAFSIFKEGYEAGVALVGQPAAAVPASAPAAQEPVEFDYPEYHAQAIGCGLEDRGITDRYEACRYGFDKAIDQVAEIIDGIGPLYTAPPAAEHPNHSGDSADMVLCSCGDGYPADSYDAGFIHGSGMCQNCDAAIPARDIQPDTVKVPRELLDLVMRCDITGGGVLAAQRAAHALLGKEGA